MILSIYVSRDMANLQLGWRVLSERVVYVGNKPLNKYILACLTLFHEGNKEIKVKARGRNISKAVEVVERLRNYFMREVKVYKVEVGSEVLPTKTGSLRRVSTISITLRRGWNWNYQYVTLMQKLKYYVPLVWKNWKEVK